MKCSKHIWSRGAASLFLFGAANTQAEWVEWIIDPGIEYRHESNLNLSAFSSDEESDQLLQAFVSGGRYYQMDNLTRLRLTADLDVERYDEFDRLNNVSVSGTAAIQHKFSVGPRAAWLRPYLTVGYMDVKEDIRSGVFGEFGVGVGQRFTDRFDMSLNFAYTNRDGKNGPTIVPGIGSDVFDQDRVSLSVTGNFLITNRWYLSGSITHYDGDFDSACTPDNVGTVLDVENVKAITLDSVFGGCVYRLNGDGNKATLDVSYAVGSHSSLNFGVTYLKGKADVLEYENTLFRASFMYSY